MRAKKERELYILLSEGDESRDKNRYIIRRFANMIIYTPAFGPFWVIESVISGFDPI
jgi:hypothetical protein